MVYPIDHKNETIKLERRTKKSVEWHIQQEPTKILTNRILIFIICFIAFLGRD